MRTNIRTIIILGIFIIADLFVMFSREKQQKEANGEGASIYVAQNDMTAQVLAKEEVGTEKKTECVNTTEALGVTEQISSSEETTMMQETATMQERIEPKEKAILMIGDSRTLGLMEYAGLEQTDFFCGVGMSVYNIHNKIISMPNIGKISLTDLLEKKQYGTIYLMLGINEVGYKFSQTIEKYRELIEFIENRQTEAVIFIEANLHVTTKYSNTDQVIKNAAIDGLNKELEKLADGERRFYLDVNPLFDDETGGLAEEKTGDGTHLYAKYYKEWGEWMMKQTTELLREGD